MNFQLYYYDYTDGENKKVSDMNICDFCVDADNGMLYYFVVGKGLYSQSLDGQNNKLIYKASENMVSAVIYLRPLNVKFRLLIRRENR